MNFVYLQIIFFLITVEDENVSWYLAPRKDETDALVGQGDQLGNFWIGN